MIDFPIHNFEMTNKRVFEPRRRLDLARKTAWPKLMRPARRFIARTLDLP